MIVNMVVSDNNRDGVSAESSGGEGRKDRGCRNDDDEGGGMMVIMEVMVRMMEVVEDLIVVIMEGVGKIKVVMMGGEMGVVVMALVEGVGEDKSSRSLGPGLLTSTCGPHEPQ